MMSGVVLSVMASSRVAISVCHSRQWRRGLRNKVTQGGVDFLDARTGPLAHGAAAQAPCCTLGREPVGQSACGDVGLLQRGHMPRPLNHHQARTRDQGMHMFMPLKRA